MITNKTPFGSYLFPNGLTVNQCKQNAKELKASYKAKGEFLSYNAALNMIAFDYMNMKWDDAIKVVEKKQDEIKYHVFKNQDPTGELSVEEEVAAYKKVAEDYFLTNGKLMLDNGSDSKTEMFAHNGTGVLVTQELLEFLDKTIIAEGGIHKVIEKHADFKVFYTDEDDKNGLNHEFYFTNEGTLFFYMRSYKEDRNYAPQFTAIHYAICYQGESIRPVQSSAHYTEFLTQFQGRMGVIVPTESFAD